jgi:hypothetical protein
MAEKDYSTGDHIDIDFTNIEGPRDFPPDGPWTAKVTKVESQKSKEGNPMLLWQLSVTDEEGTEFRPVFYNTSLLPQAIWKLRDWVNALGIFPGAEGFQKSACVGRSLKVWIRNEEYQGKPSCKVDDFAPLG